MTELVCATIALACNRAPADVAPETSLLELDLDSLTLVSVLTQVEAVFELELDADETLALLEAALVSDLVARLEAFARARL